MVNHKVTATIDDQVAITTFEQTFRNHTDRPLEATYIFPVPKGASVDKFTMWVNDKETDGELLDAKHASKVYTDIVRRTQDPGLLEYMGNSMMRLRVFPILPKSDQKVKISFKSVAQKDGNLVEYIYPIKTDGKGTRTLEEFSVKVSLKSQHAIHNIYSPTHAITTTRKGDREASIEFERNQALLDKDFQLFYGFGDKDIGLTPLMYKPIAVEDGYFMFLVSPQVEAAKVRMPRDLVLVLDVSSSMSDVKMAQAKKALKYCLGQLNADDRFSVIKFSTTVTPFRDHLVPATKDYLEAATKWVDDLRTSGGTAIWPALDEALSMRTDDAGRPFTIVFFTDGQATVDERDPNKIVKNVIAKNTANTRIFTFGVGDDVNASMLDQLADGTRAVSTYVRPAEEIQTKVASLYSKISNPVLTDVKLDRRAKRAAARNLSSEAARPVPRHATCGYRPLHWPRAHRGSAHGHGRCRQEGVRLRRDVPREDPLRQRQGLRRAALGAPQGRVPARPDPHKWRAEGTRGGGGRARQEVRHRHAVHELSGGAGRPDAGDSDWSAAAIPRPAAARCRVPADRRLRLRRRRLRAAHAAGDRPMGAWAAPGVEDFAKQQAGQGRREGLAGNRGAVSSRGPDAGSRRQVEGREGPGRRGPSSPRKCCGSEPRRRPGNESNAAFKGAKDGYQSGKLGVDLSCASNNLRNQDRRQPDREPAGERPATAWKSAACGSTMPSRPIPSRRDREGSERCVLQDPGEAPRDEGRVPARQPRRLGQPRAAPPW